MPILLVGNKVDLEHQREVPTVEGMVSTVILPLENLSKILVLQTRQKWDFFASFSNNVYLLELRVTPIFCRLWPRYGAVPSLRPVPSIARTLMKCSLRSSARWISSIAQKTEKFRVSVVSSHSISVKEKRMLNDYHRLHQVSEKCRRSSENFPSFSPHTPQCFKNNGKCVCPCRNDTFLVVFKLLWTTSLGQSCI